MKRDSKADEKTPVRSARWTCVESVIDGRPRYDVMAGDELIATVSNRTDADMICRFKVEANRVAFDVRRYLMRIRVLSEENRMLLESLRRIADMLQRSQAPELLPARTEIHRIMRKVRTRGTV